MNRDDEAKSRTNHLNRRDFLKTGLTGAVATAAFPASALAGMEKGVASPLPTAQAQSSELDDITIAELQAGINSGRYSARSITEKYLARIEAIDKQGPSLNSVIEVNPDALTIADALDKERKEKGAARPAPRHPGIDQGQHRYGGQDGHDRRLAGTGGLETAEGCIPRSQAA